MSEQIFISYRRKDASDKARLLRFFLKDCGFSVFMDTEIDRSLTFPDEIRRKICNCSDFILVVSNDACNFRSEKQDGDWLFEEMRTVFNCMMEFRSKGMHGSGPKLHLAATTQEALDKFCAMTVPDPYTAAHSHFRALTNESNLLDFEKESDSTIIKHIEAICADFRSKPREGNSNIYGYQGQSGYNANTDDEEERLDGQSRVSYKEDKQHLDMIVRRLCAREGFTGKLSVLDVGCASGDTGRRYFGDAELYGQILGIDLNQDLLQLANEKNTDPGRFIYRHMDISDADFGRQLKDYRTKKMDGKKFDIIFCCQVLHHAANRKQALAVLGKNLSDGGCLIIRGSDDGTKIMYSTNPVSRNSNIIEQIVDLTNKVPTIADRFYGRKIYSDLCFAGLDDVKVYPITVATSMLDATCQNRELMKYYEMSFSWRKDIFEVKAGDSPERIRQLEADKEQMQSLLTTLRTMLTAGGCWYMKTDFFGFGFKMT